jgi:serine/threonine-protein phosphatase 2A regulatory subunit B'
MFLARKPAVHKMTPEKPKLRQGAFFPTQSAARPRHSAHANRAASERPPFPTLPALSSAPPHTVNDLFRKKCRSCVQKGYIGCPSDALFVSAKEDALKDILSAIENPKVSITNDIPNWESVASVVAANLFRRPPPIPAEWFSCFDYFAMSDICHEPNWLHQSLVYNIGIAFVKRMKCDCTQKVAVCGDFLKLTVYLARSPDAREQHKIVAFFLVIYEFVAELRPFSWRVVSSALTRIQFEGEPFVAAKPILSALMTIIAGFDAPLDKKYLPFFHNVLLPLHRNQFFVYFAKELVTCVCQYLERDSSLVVSVFRTIIRYWPRLQPQKQMVLLDEIALFSSFVEAEWFVQCIQIVCPQLMFSLASCNSGISEKVLSMWEVNDFVWLMTSNPAVTFPTVVTKLFEVGRSYWLPEIRFLAAAVLKIMKLNSERSFDAVGKNLRKIQSLEIMKGFTSAAKWKYLIFTYEEEAIAKSWKLHMLSVLFDGCEVIDPFKKA